MIWTTSGEVVAGLRKSLVPATGWPRGCFATEIEAPRPRKVVRRRNGTTRVRKTGPRRRADVIWAPANQNILIGYEIKVTRYDLMRELAEPAKTEQWKQFCNQWYLVVGNPSIVEGMSLPEDWGVLAPPTGRATRTMTVLNSASELSPIDQTPAWCRLVGWQAWQHHLTNNRSTDLDWMDDVDWEAA